MDLFSHGFDMFFLYLITETLMLKCLYLRLSGTAD